MKTIYRISRSYSDMTEVNKKEFKAAATQNRERKVDIVPDYDKCTCNGAAAFKKRFMVRQIFNNEPFELDAFNIASDALLKAAGKSKKSEDAENSLEQAIVEYCYSIADAYNVNRKLVDIENVVPGNITVSFEYSGMRHQIDVVKTSKTGESFKYLKRLVNSM